MEQWCVYQTDGNIFIARFINAGRMYATIERVRRERINRSQIHGLFPSFESAHKARQAANAEIGDPVAMKSAIKNSNGYKAML
jgi:hypothetical protein